MELEYNWLKAPYETLNKFFRNNQKLVEKEINNMNTFINELDKKKEKISKEEMYNSLDKLVIRLQGLKRKVF